MKTSELAHTLAKRLRKDQTAAEKLLWNELRNKNFVELKFLRQHPVFYFIDNKRRFFIVDFFCSKLKLVVEVDGKIHEKQKEYDRIREEILKLKDYKIIRFKNDEIENSINSCLIRLKHFVDKIKSKSS